MKPSLPALLMFFAGVLAASVFMFARHDESRGFQPGSPVGLDGASAVREVLDPERSRSLGPAASSVSTGEEAAVAVESQSPFGIGEGGSGSSDRQPSGRAAASTDNPRPEATSPEERGEENNGAGRGLLEDVELAPEMAAVHDLFEREAGTRDWWSAVTEIELLSYFASKPGLTGNFGLPQVECRQTVCEIQAIGYSFDPIRDWQSETSDLGNQFPEFNVLRLVVERVDGRPPNETVIVLIVVREPPDSTPQSAEPNTAVS